ncbi:MAG: beta-lactamase family protein [Robiginitomaculum sp.]|nr:beta-lactamase family protein [Robiginitomaculum sp.]
MRISKIWKICVLGMVALVLQACSSMPDSAPQNTGNTEHVKTQIPPPFAITTQSLRTERIDRVLAELVSENIVPGLSVLIYEGETETYYGAAGHSDIDAKIPLKRSDVGRYYSMTKPVVGVAMMMLYEQGKFKLDDPLSKYLPEYANMKVYVGENPVGTLKLEAAKRAITIRDLMRHTSGLAYGFAPTPIDTLYNETGVLSFDRNLEQFSQKLAAMPLLYQPGTQFNYSVSTDVQGRLVELFSEQTLGDFLKENIFKPLGMTHTGFSVKASDRAKFGPVYQHGKTGLSPLRDGSPKLPLGMDVDRPFLTDVAFESGGSGLVSTIDDYAKFALMLQRNDGTLIKPATLAMMRKDQLGDMPKGHLGAGTSFGLNFAVKTTPKGTGEYPVPKGTFYWGGMAGTAFFIDDKNDLTFIMHMQVFSRNNTNIRARMAKAIYGNTP